MPSFMRRRRRLQPLGPAGAARGHNRAFRVFSVTPIFFAASPLNKPCTFRVATNARPQQVAKAVRDFADHLAKSPCSQILLRIRSVIAEALRGGQFAREVFRPEIPAALSRFAAASAPR